MAHTFKIGDIVREKHRKFVGEVVSIKQNIINVMQLDNNESTTFYEPIHFKDLEYVKETVQTPINYKNEYYKLSEENKSLTTQLIDAHASKKTVESFYRDDFYLKNRVIAFLCVVVAIETFFLIARCLI